MVYASELRAKARTALSSNWGLAILSLILFSVITNMVATIILIGSDFSTLISDYSALLILLSTETSNSAETLEALQALNISLQAINTKISLSNLINLVISGPLTLGLAYIYLDMARNKKANIAFLFKGFGKFVNSFVLMLLMSIFIALWTLLFIIPGIVKTFSYSMSFYILADNPNMRGSEALKESMYMMNGNKWRLFCLNFSFIGWILLSCLSLGIGFIWLAPYMEAANIQFYEELKNRSNTLS